MKILHHLFWAHGRASRGVYYLPDAELTEHHNLVEVIKIAPRGVVCLLSALQFHRLTTQSPFEVWLALDRKAYCPTEEMASPCASSAFLAVL